MKVLGILGNRISLGGLLLLGIWTGCFKGQEKITSPPTEVIPGAIAVFSNPPGALIYVDGSYTDLTTPDTVTNVLPGTHLLKLTSAEYKDTTLSVNVSSGLITSVDVNMASYVAILNFISNPGGAQVYYLGRYLGITPYTLYNVTPGTNIYILKLSGYVDYPQSVTIQAGETKTVYYDWTTLGYGTLVITSTPSSAFLSLDGGKKFGRTPFRFDLLVSGPHSIELELSYYLTDTIETVLPSGRFMTVHDSLTPIIIVVNSDPTGSNLYVDGQYFGLTPYTFYAKLKEGYHLVKLAKLGAQEYTQNLYLAHGDTLNINLNILFDALFYDDFNRPATSLATDWSIYEDRWREWPMGDKEPYQTQAFCLGLVEDTSFCAYLYKRDSLLIDQVTACTLFVQQYDNTGYLAAFANGELLPGISTLPSGISKASLDKYIGRKLRLSFYGCPNVYIDNLLIAGYK